jgi:hypothetical protein
MGGSTWLASLDVLARYGSRSARSDAPRHACAARRCAGGRAYYHEKRATAFLSSNLAATSVVAAPARRDEINLPSLSQTAKSE